MSVCYQEKRPVINITIKQQPQQIVKVTANEGPTVVQVQPGTFRGQKGDSPDRSIYSARNITVVDSKLVIDASLATTFYLTLTTTVTDFSIINWPNDSKSQRIALYLEQDSVGSRNIGPWPSNVKWSYGEYPVLTSRPGAVDCLVFDTFDGGVTIFGGIVGIDYH